MPQEIPYDETNRIGVRLEKLNISPNVVAGSPGSHFSSLNSSNFRPSLSPPVSASHSQINSDIQARLLAFQQKRSKPVDHSGSPSLSGSHSMTNSPNNTSLNLASINTYHESDSDRHLPMTPLELNERPGDAIPFPMDSDKFSTQPMLGNGDELSSPSVSNTTTPGATPKFTPVQGGNPFSRLPNSTSITPCQSSNPSVSNFRGNSSPSLQYLKSFELKKKPSLSQRRGMKLNMKDLTSPSGGLESPNVLSPPIKLMNDKEDVSQEQPSNPPITRQFSSGSDVGRNLSGRGKHNFRLNLDSTNSDLPVNNGSNGTAMSQNSSLNRNDSLRSISSDGSIGSDSEADKKPQLQGLFANYSKYLDIKSGLLNFAGKASLHSKGVDFLSGSSFRISLDELEYIDELGRGNYGSVLKVLHKPTGVLMAMKEVRLELDETKFTQILMELDILHKCDSPYIVDFYGAFFVEGAVYMCIEYMDGGSLDKIYGKEHGVKDEASLAYITESVIRGLKDLKDEHNIIHRDVKPTNILINTAGKVKLCDFGVSGNLVASLAKTNIGCQSYMAPERIKSMNPDDATYSVQSDIWSLGLTILEVAAGHYPYPAETYDNIFSQLSAIVDGEPPQLDPKIYSKEAQIFVKSCLKKNPDLRPSYAALLKNPWLLKYRDVDPHMDVLVSKRVHELEEDKEKRNVSRSNSLKKNPLPTPANIESVHSLLRNKVKAPALHRGGLPNNNRSFLHK